MQGTKITAVIITFNEEKHIVRCLKSVKQVADEIIVFDSRSTDNTPELCKSFHVNFVSTEWKGFATTKNEANQLASNDYILSVDADECLSAELIREILQLKSEGLNGAYSLNRLTNYCGKWIRFSGWNPDWKIRLFPKKSVQWNNAIVHEDLIIPTHCQVLKLNGRLLHYSYTSVKQHNERADKYSLLTAKKYAEEGRRATLFSPYFAAVGRFISMYFLKLGVFDGKEGFLIAWISAKSNALKYRELLKLTKN